METIRLRIAKPDDAKELSAIYAPYVLNTAVTFELEPPTREAFLARIRGTLAVYPYIVAESGGSLLGFAYCSPFVERGGYAHAAKTSIYLRDDAQGRGLGRRLYTALEALSLMQRIYNLYACIAYPIVPDEYANTNSAAFHAHMGYTLIGEFHRCANKFGRWYDMVWMEKLLAVPDEPAPFLPFPQLQEDAVRAALE